MFEDETIEEQINGMDDRGFSLAGLGQSAYYHRACGMMLYRRTDNETGGDYAVADDHICSVFRPL